MDDSGSDTGGSLVRHRSVLGNAFFNFTGQSVGFIVSIVIVPVYIGIMGIEAYGLVGFYVLIQTLVRVLDFGFTPAVNRQVAVHCASRDNDGLQDFYRTFERVFLALGGISTALLVASTPWIIDQWIDAPTLDRDRVRVAMWMIALLCGLQWPIAFYHGVLMGMERQGVYNAARIVESVVTALAVVAVLLWVSGTIDAFFVTLASVTAMAAVALGVISRRCLPTSGRPPVARFALVREVSGFATGMTAISITSIVLSQADKLVLSNTRSLEEFGLYTVAVVMTGVLVTLVITPVFSAIFPRCTALTARGDDRALAELYHTSTQGLAVLLIPIATGMIVFAEQLVTFWIGDPVAASRVAPILRFMAVGFVCNGLMNPAYALQLAAGWVRLPVAINIFLIVFTLPALLLLVPRGGGIVCAQIWAYSMIAYVVVGVPLTHRRVLRGHAVSWFLRDLAPPLVVSSFVYGAAILCTGPLPVRWWSLAVMATVGVVALAASFAACTELRRSGAVVLANVRDRARRRRSGDP